MDHGYHCMRLLNITNELISKTRDHVNNTMLLWRELNFPVTPLAHLFEDHIIHQMKNIVGKLADKSEVHIKRGYQDCKRSETIYCSLTIFQQSQTLQLKINKMRTNHIVKLKSEQIKEETKKNLKRKK